MKAEVTPSSYANYIRSQAANLIRFASDYETLANGGTLPPGLFAEYLDGTSPAEPYTAEVAKASIESTIRNLAGSDESSART